MLRNNYLARGGALGVTNMDVSISVYCFICFAMPGEMCRTKYLVHGLGEVTPVICPTHATRLIDSQRFALPPLYRAA